MNALNDVLVASGSKSITFILEIGSISSDKISESVLVAVFDTAYGPQKALLLLS